MSKSPIWLINAKKKHVGKGETDDRRPGNEPPKTHGSERCGKLESALQVRSRVGCRRRGGARMPWSDDLTQYAGHLHAGAIAALLDTACGFAAATLIGPVTASHFSMNCLRPAVARGFIAKGATVRAGCKQTFARAELFAEDGSGKRSLVATGETLLVALG
jgi:uncharacterized protein (TIGR00369 family)